ncbi:hypothetical protein [Bacillus licheniformis]|uniref:hypothetical protein n=1 Tax=Bacillus licheniformis TaxID=1402 RepID=UPI0016011D13|nr:hypothetical protein [Bacillus licheniformis]MBJ7886653.1 hypothetical protein [Bacillaceae bacterium HSR45]MBM6848378.1 hypothetical protein [Bacillus licheniformis]MCA1184480.1 hypothetical protein [Bacillus licheniformis]MCM3373776.1 hypothetical protein [Bacillus licheniformis]MCM3750896.1 hypothetical protein [Bacillus licheniformis]
MIFYTNIEMICRNKAAVEESIGFEFQCAGCNGKGRKRKDKSELYNDWDTKGFCMADRKNQSYCPTWLFYRFALFNT